jgi:uncharacterized protein YigE (DUF2233 family)
MVVYLIIYQTLAAIQTTATNFCQTFVAANQTTATGGQNFGYQPNGVFLPQNIACHKCGYYQTLAWQTMAENQTGI